MKVLITGGGGFIGQYVVAALTERKHVPIVFDTHKEPCDWPAYLGDIRDATAVTEAVAHVDAVIHLAGVLGTQETINNPRPAAETNILGGLNVLEACAQYDVPLVNIAVGNWFEFSTYSITKYSVERFAEMFCRYRGNKITVVRALNAYGPKQSVSQPYGHSRVRKIIPSFTARALHGDTIQVYGDGSQIMDMIYVKDVASVLAVAAHDLYEHRISRGTLEAGSGRRTSVLEIAQAVQCEVERQTGIRAEIEHLPMRAGETPGVEVVGDPSTLAPLAFKPEQFTRLEDGLVSTVSFYKLMFHK